SPQSWFLPPVKLVNNNNNNNNEDPKKSCITKANTKIKSSAVALTTILMYFV
uniref:Uncharacterized protein n=1 Tax=Amphimedon queenslandica TaxID=400682 RepID=A0A1X7VVF1_AMPQE